MQVWLRLLVVWFIAIALPVQGIAGVTMAHCGASHERMVVATGTAQHRHAAHAAAGAHHHALDGAGDTARADQADAGPGKAPAGKLSDRAQSKCSACASCCAGSALPSAAPRLPEAPAASTAFADVLVAVDAFTSDGPDRPPRQHPV